MLGEQCTFTMHHLIDIVLHLDHYLSVIIQHYGALTYLILFAILFAETGLVIAPFLPGDSLLFAVGTVTASAAHPLGLGTIFALLFSAVLLGDNVNYWIGYFVGPRVFTRNDVRLLNRKHLERTHAFFEKYGTRTIIYARFVPIVRTCAPFVAGIGRMSYTRFLVFSVFGCLSWLSACLFGGYFFGSIPAVQKNFSLVILAIMVISMLPVVVEYLRHRRTAEAV